MTVFSGCYTALITPFLRNREVDYEGLQRLVEFQLSQGANGILACGTTGESPTLDWNEHNKVTERVHEFTHSKGLTIAGTGSNSTQEAIEGTINAQHTGINCVLLVDPYYNGPSSLEIRREYIEPIAKQFPEMQIIPYIIPGRTGTQLLPQDVAQVAADYPNVRCVKEATGDLENMRLTRKLCGGDFDILSGDDDKTFAMMSLPEIAATGVISVTSNVAPRAVSDMVHYLLDGNILEAKQLAEIMQPLFSVITVKTQEQTPFGPAMVRARNPLATKTLMNVLGMPSGPCRQPLGKMTRAGLELVLQAARKVYEAHPEILRPIEQSFNVDLMERLNNEKYLEGLFYD
ncbi:MAG TPA: 4-hydroxy-tetrahydrodipicolinate synthase [Candidatus Nanoarchaeia archaeon]|nr:4-hydroxy-tetrahydrodipicolinate synthase [Candidatus Nanoarchaeia archaeon]